MISPDTELKIPYFPGINNGFLVVRPYSQPTNRNTCSRSNPSHGDSEDRLFEG